MGERGIKGRSNEIQQRDDEALYERESREEVGREGKSMIAEVESLVGGAGRVSTILKMKHLMTWLEAHGKTEELKSMQQYRDEYGVKDA